MNELHRAVTCLSV